MTKRIADTGIDRDEALALALKAPSKMYAWVLKDLLTELQERRESDAEHARKDAAPYPDTQTEPDTDPDRTKDLSGEWT